MLNSNLLAKFKSKLEGMIGNQEHADTLPLKSKQYFQKQKDYPVHEEEQSKCNVQNLQENITIKYKGITNQIDVGEARKLTSELDNLSGHRSDENLLQNIGKEMKRRQFDTQTENIGQHTLSHISKQNQIGANRIILSSDGQENDQNDINAILYKQPPFLENKQSISCKLLSQNFQVNNDIEQQNRQLNSFPQTLTDGRHYSEQFRRKFTLDLLQISQNMCESELKQLVKQSSQKINVFVYQIRIWLSAYDLIFAIENQQCEYSKPLSEEQLDQCIKRYFLAYLNNNQNDKKYKVVKVLNYVFRSFGINEQKVTSWLANVLETSDLSGFTDLKFDHYDVRGIRLPKFLKTTRTRIVNRQVTHRTPTKRKRINRSNYLNSSNQHNIFDEFQKTKKVHSNNNSQISSYPQSFRKNIAIKFDSVLKIAFQKLYKRQSLELCVDIDSLRQIHESFGKLQILRGQHQIAQLQQRHTIKPQNLIRKKRTKYLSTKSNHKIKPKKTVFINKDYPRENNDYLAKLQEILYYFLRTHAQAPLTDLQKQCDAVMDRYVFTDKLKSEVRTKWFAYFLKKYHVHRNQRGLISYRGPK